MRPKNRIPRILGKLQTIWELSPDLRFYQLLIVYAGLDIIHLSSPSVVFNIEDDKLEEMLDRVIKTLKK